MKKLILLLFLCSLTTLSGCSNIEENNTAHIALMELSTEQQEILDLFSHPGQEFLIFEYTGNSFTDIEIWVEVYNYGELVGQYSTLRTFADTPMDVRPIAISISQTNQREFQWSLSIGGSRSTSEPWAMEEEFLGRAFGPIREPVEIVSGQEIILYLSKFTTGGTLSTMNDLQYYLVNPESLASYTYVHLIKVRFIE